MSTMTPRARRVGWAVGMILVVVLVVAGASTTPQTGMSDDRLYSLAGQMKCLQCLGESVAGSQSDIAQEMRAEIRRQMRKGRSDDEILTYFADRYGQRVLLTPSASGLSSVVWILPVVAAGLGVAGLGFAFATWRRQRDDASAADVSAEDEALVAAAVERLEAPEAGR